MHVLIADDHASMRQSLKEMLREAFPDLTFSEEVDGNGVIAAMAKRSCDVLLLDFEMPGRNGFEVLHDVKQLYPHVPVIMVTGKSEHQYALRCLQAGASGFVNKNRVPEELQKAIETVTTGGEYVSPGLANARNGGTRSLSGCVLQPSGARRL